MSKDRIPSAEIISLIGEAFPSSCVRECRPLSGGLINSNYKLQLDSFSDPVVLRIYERNPESCAKELALLTLVRETVPVPEVLYGSPSVDRPFLILSYVEGVTFQELKRTGNRKATEQASYSIGRTLAAIGKYNFNAPGVIGPGLNVSERYLDGPDEVPKLVERWLCSNVLQQRLSRDLQDRLHKFIWEWAPRLNALSEERALVHGDFSSRNLLVCESSAEQWVVSGVVDWEFALSGSPLMDVGHFLRYETRRAPLREPHFSRGYTDGGGVLPEDWETIARVLDLTALVDLLTWQDLPADIVSEVPELVHATLRAAAFVRVGWDS